ncbi:MAG: hypothetical protein ACFFBD_10115 [Candidatus Hodarchaeota archaeon]
MQSRIFNLNWNDFEYKDPEQRRQLAGALQYFCALPAKDVPKRFEKVKEFKDTHNKIQMFTKRGIEGTKSIKEFTLAGDGWTNEAAIMIAEKFHLVTDYDTGYEQIFDIRNYVGSKASGFDVADVQSGLTFRVILPGDKLYVYQMEGEKSRCYFHYYGGALGWHRQLFEDGDWWTIEDNAIEFRNKAYSNIAATYYALIEAVSTAKGCCAVVPADAGAANPFLSSTANTLNWMAQTILQSVSGKGYGATAQNAQFIVLTPLGQRGRIRRALEYTDMHYSTSAKTIDYNFTMITSMMLTNPNRVYVILPKRKLKGGTRMDLTLFDDFDILSYTDTVAGWNRFGACIGDTDQIECVDFEPYSGSCPP